MFTLSIAAPAHTLPTGKHAAHGSQEAAALHLTRRGWIVVVALPLALLAAGLLVLGAFFSSEAKAAGDAAGQTATVNVNVASGETLWSLAAEYAPERDPRVVIEQIIELNALSTSTVQAGQSLHIPVSRP